MAIDNPDMPLKECSAAVKSVKYNSFNLYFKNDAFKTLILTLLSFFTIGILYIVYTGPLFIAKKTAFYTAHKLD